MAEFVKTTPSKVYAFDFPAGSEVTQSDLYELAEVPSGEFQELDEPDGSSVVTQAREPLAQETDGQDCALMCAAQVLGFEDIITAVGIASTPIPKSMLPVRKGVDAKNATKFTNIPSVIINKTPKLRNSRIRRSIPTPMIKRQFPYVGVKRSANVFRVFSRYMPGIGWGLLAVDIVLFARCYNKCMHPVDSHDQSQFFDDVRREFFNFEEALKKGWSPFR